jgi:hypothetical protein
MVIFITCFPCYLLKVHLHQSSKVTTSYPMSHITVEIKVFLYFFGLLMEGSGFGLRTNNYGSGSGTLLSLAALSSDVCCHNYLCPGYQRCTVYCRKYSGPVFSQICPQRFRFCPFFLTKLPNQLRIHNYTYQLKNHK